MLSNINGFNALEEIGDSFSIDQEHNLEMRGFASLKDIKGKLEVTENVTLKIDDDKPSALLYELFESNKKETN